MINKIKALFLFERLVKFENGYLRCVTQNWDEEEVWVMEEFGLFVCLFVNCFGNPHFGESKVIHLHVLPQSTTKGGCQCISLNRKVPLTSISPLQYTKEKPLDLDRITPHYSLGVRGSYPEPSHWSTDTLAGLIGLRHYTDHNFT